MKIILIERKREIETKLYYLINLLLLFIYYYILNNRK